MLQCQLQQSKYQQQGFEMEIAKIKPTNYVYNKKQMIGKGAFGEVYLGYNEKQHFPVAVKIVSFQRIAPVMNKQTLLSKLKQEIINMQIAKNQNLVKLLDAQVSSRNLYIICEFCNGQSFDNFLKRKGYLTEHEALSFFKEILRGFQNLHLKKIVHRDLKPANLLMHNFSIKIADLGFSKAIDQHSQLLQSIVGTPLYMSPQIFNREKYTEKTDIWSLGVILYQMLYGKIPWRAKSLMELKQKVQKYPVQFPPFPAVTLNTRSLIQSMLQLQQTKRVSWQELFKKYISVPQEAPYMVEEQKQDWHLAYKKITTYINKANYIQSQNQLVKVLTELKIKSKQEIQQQNSYQKSDQFFISQLFLKKNKFQILSYCFYFFGRRNRVCYLFRIFQFCTQMVEEIQNLTQNLAFVHLYTTQLLILKFTIHSIHKMLNRNIDIQQQKDVASLVQAGPCYYPQHIQALLVSDFQNISYFYDIFMKDYYLNKMEVLKRQNELLFVEMHKQLSGFYPNQIGDYKFVKFMLGNSLRSVFNQLKDFQPKSQKIYILTRMIYEFEKDKELFQLGNLLESYKSQKNGSVVEIVNTHDLHKKFTQWKNDQKWIKRLSELPTFPLQSLNSFINKEFKWNPLHIYATDIIQ